MSKDRRSRDQKRRDKLASKRRQESNCGSLAYSGDRFKRDELLPSLMHAEIGIYESFVMTERKLLDETVFAALETLIREIRKGTLSSPSDANSFRYDVGQEVDLVVWNVCRNWDAHFADAWKPTKEQRIGILRTILGSIEKMRAAGPGSQRYLHHIEDFLTKKLGVSVKPVRAATQSPSEPIEESPATQMRIESGENDSAGSKPQNRATGLFRKS